MVIFTVIEGGLSGVARGSTYNKQAPHMENLLDFMLGVDKNILSYILNKGLPIIPLLEGDANNRSIDLAWLRIVLQEKLDNVYTDISRLSLTNVLNDVNSELVVNDLPMIEFTRKEVYDVLVSLTGRTIFAY